MRASVSEILSRDLARVAYCALPGAVADKTCACMLDFFAAGWDGAAHRLHTEYAALALELGGNGHAPIFGGQAGVPFWSAFANAACAHFTEVDDTHKKSSMHIGSVVFPVVLALAPVYGLDGKRIIECAVCGYEAAARIGMALGTSHAARFHSTGTAGTFGAAAAAAKAMGLDGAGIAHALGHAGTQASGLWQFLPDGALSAKALHPGRAAQNGILAATLAQRGIAGATRIIEGERGFCARFADQPDPQAVCRDFGEPFMVMEAGFKTYPVCGQIHSPLDALATVLTEMEDRREVRENITSVTVHTFRQAINLTDRPQADTLEGAKFSTQTCLAFMLVHGDLNFANFIPERIFLPEVRRLAGKISMLHDPAMEADYPAGRPCRVTVRFADGTVRESTRLHRQGDPENPLTNDALAAKFRQLSGALLSGRKQDWIIDWIYGLASQEALSPELFTPTAPVRGTTRH